MSRRELRSVVAPLQASRVSLFLPKAKRTQLFSFQYCYLTLIMLRIALKQSARCASKSVLRIQLPVSRTTTPCLFFKISRPAAAPQLQAIRWYSAPAELTQQEVEGRIMDLLKNFDKVRKNFFSDVFHSSNNPALGQRCD